MDQLPPGFEIAEASQPTTATPQMPSAAHDELPAGFSTNEELYGGTANQIKAGLEGAAEGVLGPLAPLAEKHLLGVPEHEILGRKEEFPITHGVGQAVGLGAGLLTGTGEAAVMSKAGTLAAEAAGFGKVINAAEDVAKAGKMVSDLTKAGAVAGDIEKANLALNTANEVQRGLSFGSRVGSEAVKQAAENAILQGSDEVSKMILNDPNTSAESAIANIGLASAIGGGIGGVMGGAGKIWDVTAAPHVDGFLNGLKNHLNGGAKLVVPEETAASLSKLGVEPDAVIKAALSKDVNAIDTFNVLKEMQNKEVLGSLEKLHNDIDTSIMKKLNVNPDDMMVFSNAEAGNDLLNSFKKEYTAKYEPFEQAYKARNAEAAKINVPDQVRLDSYGRLLENAIEKIGTDSPYYKLYDEYGQRLLAKDTVGGMDQLKTEINNRIKGLKVGGDYNVINALQDIKGTIADIQENTIMREAKMLGAEGKELGEQMIKERQALNNQYKEFANMSDELTNHLGVGDFHGAKGLEGKLTDKLSPEQLLNKFSFKNNAEFIPFLEQHFPETLQAIKQNELKQMIKPAFLSAKGEAPVNIKKLADIVDKNLAGKKEYVEALLPADTIEALKAAKQVVESMPNPKSSGTAGWMTKVFDKMPQSAMAGIAMVAGHNPIFGYAAGHMSQMLGKNLPESMRLSYLKFLASDVPVNAPGFKAMLDFATNTYRQQNMLAKATTAVFQGGKNEVITNIPSVKDRENLDKKVTDIQSNPSLLIKTQGNSNLAHYMNEQQTAASETTTRATNYLASIKPQPYRSSPLDAEIQPSEAEKARYHRALDIAQQPLMVMEHIKQGTLQASDIQDLNNMYPGLYKQMVGSLSNQISNMQAGGIAIPYKTKLSLSLFMGQPLESNMTPQGIMAAQPKIAPPQPPQAQPKRGSASKLGKTDSSYMTKTQKAEANRD